MDGKDITDLSHRELRSYRRRMQLVCQHPDTALNPRYRLYRSIAEPLRLHRVCARAEEPERVEQMLNRVGLHREVLSRYPHEVSGGQVQRAVVARALTLSPRFLLLDEPTSMLDVSVQAQVVRLFLQLQRELALSYLFITHDLDLAAAVSHRVLVMSQGRIVESGPTREVLENPREPFTRSLVEAFAASGAAADAASDGTHGAGPGAERKGGGI